MKRLLARFGMIAGVLFAIAMLISYFAVDKGIFEVEPAEIIELREKNDSDERTWLSSQVAWLRLDGTHIDYPVMQTSDNYWFLNHDFYNNESVSGAIFLDFRNAPDFSDKLSIIYGHRMNGSLMFSDIAKYRDVEYLVEHSFGELIFSGQSIKLHVKEYREITAEDKLYRDLSWQGEERVLVLSTCDRSNHNLRDVLILEYE